MKQLVDELNATKRKVNELENRFLAHKDMFLECYELLAEFVNWYMENTQEISQNLGVSSSVVLNTLMHRAKILGKKATVL